MKKTLHLIYLIGISLLIFSSLLAVGKGYDISEVMSTTPGTIYLIVLLLSTFVEMGYLGKRKNKEKEVDSTQFSFKQYDIEKSLLEKLFSEIILMDKDNYKTSYALEDKTINIKILVKKLEDVEIAKITEQIKETVTKGLKEKFGINDEFKMKFNVVENIEMKEIKAKE